MIPRLSLLPLLIRKEKPIGIWTSGLLLKEEFAPRGVDSFNKYSEFSGDTLGTIKMESIISFWVHMENISKKSGKCQGSGG